MPCERLTEAQKDKRKKVLFVLHQLNYGGAQKAALSALNAIDYERYDVTLYVRKARLDLLPLVNPSVSRVIVNDDKSHYYRRPYALLLQLLALLSSLRGKHRSRFQDKLQSYVVARGMQYEKKHFFTDGQKYDIAVSYVQGYHALFVSKCINAKRKIMFYHGSTDELHEIHEEVFRDFSAIYCVSEPAQKEIRRLFPAYADKIRCLDNVVDADLVRSQAAAVELQRPEDKLILCSCGRFAPVKGFDLAVETAARLRDAGVFFLWYFVGDGPERAALELQIEEKGLCDYIKITGMQDNPYPYMKACDIFVQPSREEAQGLTIIEAQILCRPVVSTRTAGGLALVRPGETGLLADIDPSALADAIKKLSNDAVLRKHMETLLSKVDYEAKQRRFREQWAALLEGE